MSYNKKQAKKKKDWTNWVIIGIIAVFIIAVACIYGVRRYNALGRTYIKVGDYKITKLEYDYYFGNIYNNFSEQNSQYMMFMGIDTEKDLADQVCIYDTSLSWKDYFDQQTVPYIQNVKAAVNEAKATGYEYDTDAAYNSYMISLRSSLSSQGIPEKTYFKQYYGEFANAKRLASVIKDNLLYESYYSYLQDTYEVTAEDIRAKYESDPSQYDSIDYHLYTLVADYVGQDEEPSEEVKAEQMDATEKRAEEFVERLKNGEDWRQLCYEYARETSKQSFDPESESDSTEIKGSTAMYISPGYVDWLYDESRVAGDVMTYRDDDNNAVFVIRFDAQTKYDLEADSMDIAGTLDTEKVTMHLDELIVNLPLSDPDNHLLYDDKKAAAETAQTENADAAAQTGE